MNEHFSRKGAKAQRKVAKKIRIRTCVFLAALRLCVSLFLLVSLATPGISQRKTPGRFDPDGSFWIDGAPPAEFSDFDSINLNAKRSRLLNPPGLLIETTNYRFKTLNVKRENFTFTTVVIRGVSYSFAGRFLKGGVYAAGDFDSETPVLEGKLTKFRGGKKVAEASLKFVYFGGT